jgi:hypothetical protein
MRPRTAAVVAAGITCLAVASLPASASAGQVTTSADGNQDGTLRHEIDNAVPGETITFDPGVNPELTMSHITIATNITLVGNGIGQTTIKGDEDDRVFNINLGSPATVTIRNLTITRGRAPPGVGFVVVGENGGAIFHTSGSLTIDGVEFSDNRAGTGSTGSTGSSGTTGGTGDAGGGGGSGGAIWSSSNLTVRNSIFHDNRAGMGGGGGMGGNGSIGAGGTGGAGGAGGQGGAITAGFTLEISNTTFSDNQAGLGGNGGPSGSGGGGFPGAGGAGGPGGRGGVVTQAGIPPPTSITGSTFNGNEGGQGGTGGGGFPGGNGGTGGAGGALSMSFSQVTNSTFTANGGGQGGSGGDVVGGGGTGGDAGAVDGGIDIRAATIAGNHSGLGGSGGSGGGAGPSGAGGGFRNSGAGGTFDGTIIALNTVGGSTTDPTSNCTGAPPTVTFGLTFPGGTGCPGTVADPLLGPLLPNGGPTQTMALSAGSPAIDQVPPGATACPGTDQRGVGRPQGPACDIGAYERVPTPAAALPTFVLLASKVKINRKGKGRLPFSCTSPPPDRCVVAGALSAGGKAKASRVGQVSGIVAAGATGNLTVKLSKAGRSRLVRKGKLRASLAGTVTNNAGSSAPLNATLKLKPKR